MVISTENLAIAIEKLGTVLPMEIVDDGDTPSFWLRVASLSLGQRALELCKSTVAQVQGEHPLAAALTARAALETAASLHYLHKKIQDALETRKFDELDEVIRRAFLGRRDKELEPPTPALQVLTCIGHLGKLAPATEKAYVQLSEYAHPNWWGTAGMFCRLSEAPNAAAFGMINEDAELPLQEAIALADVSAKLASAFIEMIEGVLKVLSAARAIATAKPG